MRSLASGKAVTQFGIATNEYIGQGKEKAEYQYKGKVYRAGGLKIARRRTVALPGLSTHCVLSTAAAR